MNKLSLVIDNTQPLALVYANPTALAYEEDLHSFAARGNETVHINEMTNSSEGKKIHKNFTSNKYKMGYGGQPTIRKDACKENMKICEKYNLPWTYVNGSGKDGSTYQKISEKTEDMVPHQWLSLSVVQFISLKNQRDIFTTKAYRESQPFKIGSRQYNRINRINRKKDYVNVKNYAQITNLHYKKSYFPLLNMLNTSAALNEPEVDLIKPINEDELLEVIVYNTNKNTKDLIDSTPYYELKKSLPALSYDNIENGSVVMIGDEIFLKIQKNAQGEYNVISLADEKIVDTVPTKKYFVTMITNLAIDLTKTVNLSFEQILSCYDNHVLVASPSQYNFKTIRDFK